ncbi:MAG: hypothetical protein ACLS4V_01045 [Oscillospiraceae bacterium]
MEQKHGLPYFEDGRYIGEGYPALIERSAPRGSGKRTAEHAAAENAAQKALRRLCCAALERVEKIVTDLLNELIHCPDRVRPSTSQMALPAENAGGADLRAGAAAIDEDNARALLLQLAAEQYDAIGNTEYETVRLRRLLTGRSPCRSWMRNCCKVRCQRCV